MQKNILGFLLSSLITLLLFWVLSIPLGPAPPLGPFLNPAEGFWANAETHTFEDQTFTLNNSALSKPVQVYYDNQRIPHIFAENDNDLYFAQGYITARDRLFQMELQTYAAAGRLSEILGPRMLNYDRYQRQIGMVYGAEQTLQGVLKDEQTAAAVQAYAAGVNAWINQLNPENYPLEYKILDFAPEKWTPLKTALLLKYMSYTLASGHSDVRMSNTKAYFGEQFIKNILDIKPELDDPIIPPGTPWNFKPLSVQKPDSAFVPDIVKDVLPFQANPANGSNNWAVSGSKTASGYPILANDPHLNLSLPSIWYAVQLHSPDQNVMGVTLPGAPAVIIGFNEDIAWGTTNTGADVWDWYQITFRDSTRAEYRYGDEWRKTTKRAETIKIKGQPAETDTIIYTHYGPVINASTHKTMPETFPVNYAIRWIAYEESDEVNYFLHINKARNFDDYRQALQYYGSPAQNWIFADSSDIAITVTGKYPLKWDEQGRYIGDGSNPRYDWQGWIPFQQIPFVKNPGRGFVSSANQNPTDSSYPYYLDADFTPYERGRRINDRLAAMNNITAQDMQHLQLDTYSYHAKTILPLMLDNLQTDTLSGWQQKAAQLLKDWDYNNEGEQIAPSLFLYWWNRLDNAIWKDEYDSAHIPLKWPARDQVVQFIRTHPESKWYDDITTPEKETLSDLINQSFSSALSQLSAKYGSFGDSWKWGYVNNTNINHLGQIPGLGRENLFTDGGRESINAINGSHGPSWRMVVELGPTIKAYGIYPGGESGNPGSPYYDNMIDDWNAGKLYPLWFMRQKPAAEDSVAYKITLQ